MILDTSFIIDLFDGEQDAWDKALEMHQAGIKRNVTIQTIFELEYGAEFLRLEGEEEYEEEFRNLQNLLLLYDIVEPKQDDLEKGADLLAVADHNADDSSGVEKFDAVIGGVAENRDQSVLTDNVDDFEDINVDVEEY